MSIPRRIFSMVMGMGMQFGLHLIAAAAPGAAGAADFCSYNNASGPNWGNTACYCKITFQGVEKTIILSQSCSPQPELDERVRLAMQCAEKVQELCGELHRKNLELGYGLPAGLRK